MSRRPSPTRLPFTITDQLEWASGIARQVARRGGLRGQELDDLVGVAHYVLCDLISRPVSRNGFDLRRVPASGDPEAAFRGWAYLTIRSECVRMSRRLRNGGTYHTCRPHLAPAAVTVLGDSAEELEERTQQEEADRQFAHDVAEWYRREIMDPLEDVPYGRRLALGRRRRA